MAYPCKWPRINIWSTSMSSVPGKRSAFGFSFPIDALIMGRQGFFLVRRKLTVFLIRQALGTNDEPRWRPPFLPSLPDQPGSYLDAPWRIRLGGNQSEAAVGRAQIRRAEGNTVRQVEAFESQLQVRSLSQRDPLQHREVPVLRGVAAQI